MSNSKTKWSEKIKPRQWHDILTVGQADRLWDELALSRVSQVNDKLYKHSQAAKRREESHSGQPTRRDQKVTVYSLFELVVLTEIHISQISKIHTSDHNSTQEQRSQAKRQKNFYHDIETL